MLLPSLLKLRSSSSRNAQSVYWQQYLDFVERMYTEHPTSSGGGILYIMVHARSSCWYLGRTSDGRQVGGVWRSGPVARGREHFVATFRAKHSRSTEVRYRVWKPYGPYHLGMLPVYAGERWEVGQKEGFGIRVLQPPSQRVGRGHGRLRPAREKPRSRLREFCTSS